MTPAPDRHRAALLREAFDRAFAEAWSPEAGAFEDLLDVSVGSARYAIRLAEIAALAADVPITPLPTSVPALIGIAGFRDEIVPVYDLGALLGHAAEAGRRWLAVAAGDTPVALAFAALERHLRVPAAAVAARDPSDAAPYIGAVAHLEPGPRLIVSIPSILMAIADRTRAASARE